MQQGRRMAVVRISGFSRECLEKARKNHGLERSLKVSIPDEVYDSLEKEFDGIDSK